jgi:uncharacterized protein YkwD
MNPCTNRVIATTLRVVLRKLLLALGVLSLLVALTACGPTTDESVFASSINATRVARKLPPLAFDDGFHAKALAWSTQMANAQKLSHSPLKTWYPPGWKALGENVGVGPSLPDLAAAFIASPAHLQNMIDPRFKRMSVAVVKRGNVYWVTEVFVG